MSPQVLSVMGAIRALSVEERAELAQALISAPVGLDRIMAGNTAFWQGVGIDALIADQGGQPVTDVRHLASDVWPEDEPLDEFLNAIAQQRRQDQLAQP